MSDTHRSLRIDTEKGDLVYGDPANDSGYFIAGAGAQGARWATDGGGFTGKADKAGLDSSLRLSEETSLHMGTDWQKRNGELGLLSGGRSLVELFGSVPGMDAYEVGARGSFDVGDLKLDPSLSRLATGERATLGVKGGEGGAASASYNHNDDGTSSWGLNMEKAWGGLLSTFGFANDKDDTQKATAGLKGEGFSSSAGYSRAADGKGRLELGVDKAFGSSSASAGLVHDDQGDTVRLGLSQTENGVTAARGLSLGLGAGTAESTFKLTDPTTTASFRQSGSAAGQGNALDVEQKLGSGSLRGGFSMLDNAITGATLGGALALEGGSSITGGASFGKDGSAFDLAASQRIGDEATLSQKLGMQFGEAGIGTSFGMGADLKPGPGLSLSTALDASLGADGHHVVSGKVGQGYTSESGAIAQRLALSGSSDSEKGGSLEASGSFVGRLFDGVYSSLFGSASVSDEKGASAFGGGGLTYMPSNRVGVTAAGGYGTEGWEARLQADFFKDKVDSAAKLDAQRRSPMISGYLGASGGGPGGRLDGQYGAGDFTHGLSSSGGTTITAGVGIGF